MTHADKEFWFLILGLPFLIIFARLFLIGTIAWVGTALVYPFYLTRWIWIALAYVLGNAWFMSAKIFGLLIPVVGLSYYFGYKQPLDWTVYALFSLFFWWPMWIFDQVIKVFG